MTTLWLADTTTEVTSFARDLAINVLGNLVWVALVIIVLWIFERRRRRGIEAWRAAYLQSLLRSVVLLKHAVFPYVHLLHVKADHGDILHRTLSELGHLLARILTQVQDALRIVESEKMQEQLLDLHRSSMEFETRIAANRVTADIVLGNPTELTDPARVKLETAAAVDFVRSYTRLAKAVFDGVSHKLKATVPPSVVASVYERTALEHQYDPA